jgi:flavin reductase (DIM6/NTAB) family NADH-FMN oxidoreductase RutF
MQRAIDPAELDLAARHRLTIGTVVPRPIAWITSTGPGGGVNVAPFSYFMGCHSYLPAIAVSIGSRAGQPKDTRANIRSRGEFVVNMVTRPLAERMNVTAAAFPPDISEADVAGLGTAPSVKVAPPRLAESPVAWECRVLHALDLGEDPVMSTLFVAQIVMFHVDDALLDADLKVDPHRLDAIARLGGPFYTTMGEIFRMDIPDWQSLVSP